MMQVNTNRRRAGLVFASLAAIALVGCGPMGPKASQNSAVAPPKNISAMPAGGRPANAGGGMGTMPGGMTPGAMPGRPGGMNGPR